MASLLVPPISVRGMTQLDRDAFTTVVAVPSVTLSNVTISDFIPLFKKHFLKMRNFKPVQETSNGVVIYLNPAFAKDERSANQEFREKYQYVEDTKITLKYENWQRDVILKAILPEGVETPLSYSLVGHIVHLNLRESQLPYKNVIGEVYLDTVPHTRTVVNKINTIDTTFRHFSMEILAGDKDTVTTVKEFGFAYQFDFAQVYWNPRLSTEHKNLISLMKKGDVLYDVFAGVGPFAIPAAKQGVRVLANDLNPESYRWLQKNAKLNKIKETLKCFNLDGREFLQNIVKDDMLKRRKENAVGTEHIAMNLPASAVEFLDVFFDFTKEEIRSICSKPPTIHLYCFVKLCTDQDPCKLAKSLVEERLGCTLSENNLIDLHDIRNVSPNKNMIRVSFLLTENILNGEEPATKKPKLENNTGSSVTDNIAGNDGKEQRKEQDQECIQSSNSS